MGEHNLNAISPIDGRYASKTSELNDFFSEKALMNTDWLLKSNILLACVSLEYLN